MKIRKFTHCDAEFCFQVRNCAFNKKFSEELTPQVVSVCIKAYTPEDYIRMSKIIEFFIVENMNNPIGFFTIKKINRNTAEIPLIYLDLKDLKKGIGKACIQFIEKWISAHWITVNNLYLDTIIPKSNAGFYKKMGFIPAGIVNCTFQNMRVEALRLRKRLVNPE